MIRLAFGLLALVVALLAAIAGRAFYYSCQDYGGRAPPGPLLDHPDPIGIPGLRAIEIADGAGPILRGWYVPARNRAAIILTSGTNANRSGMLPEVRILAAAGFGVLAFDWPGTGRSEGRIDWGEGALAALTRALTWLQQQSDVDPDRIGALGFSAGAMVTARLASTNTRLRAVALTGSSPDADKSPHWLHPTPDPLHALPEEWAARWYGWPVGVVRPVELVSRIAPRPLLLIGGTLDTNADAEQVARMCAAAREPKECWVVPGATHGAYAAAAPAQYARRVTEFFTRALVTP